MVGILTREAENGVANKRCTMRRVRGLEKDLKNVCKTRVKRTRAKVKRSAVGVDMGAI
jgi:hypothetical protein